MSLVHRKMSDASMSVAYLRNSKFYGTGMNISYFINIGTFRQRLSGRSFQARPRGSARVRTDGFACKRYRLEATLQLIDCIGRRPSDLLVGLANAPFARICLQTSRRGRAQTDFLVLLANASLQGPVCKQNQLIGPHGSARVRIRLQIVS